MKGVTRIAAAAGLAVSGMIFTPIVLADFVARVHNESNVEAKGMVQNHPPIMWLKRGQVNDIRLGGKWLKDIKGTYTVNFEHLSNTNVQYCVWKVRVLFPFTAKGEKFTAKDIGGSMHVKLEVNLERSEPGFKCEVSGQYLGRFLKAANKSAFEAVGNALTFPFQPTDDQGATLDFFLRNEKK